MLCGNKKKSEIELVTLFSDDDGNDDEIVEYICKEDKGCGKVNCGT
jgi:hypothetical protein